jgi:hypothetical protein
MRRAVLMIAVVAAVAAAATTAYSFDLRGLLANHEPADKFAIIHWQTLANLMADPSARTYVYDANLPGVRASLGVIPGAHLLSSSDHYDVAATLPADKRAKLIFYCHDTH